MHKIEIINISKKAEMQFVTTIKFIDDIGDEVANKLLFGLQGRSMMGKEYYSYVLNQLHSSLLYRYILRYFRYYIQSDTSSEPTDSVRLLCDNGKGIEKTASISIIKSTPSYAFFLLLSVFSVYSDEPRIFNRIYFQHVENAIKTLKNDTVSDNACMMLIDDILYIDRYPEVAEIHPELPIAAKIDVNRMLEGTLQRSRAFTYTNPSNMTEMQINAIANYIKQKRLPSYGWVNLAPFRQMNTCEKIDDYALYMIAMVYNYVVSATPIVIPRVIVPPVALPVAPFIARPTKKDDELTPLRVQAVQVMRVVKLKPITAALHTFKDKYKVNITVGKKRADLKALIAILDKSELCNLITQLGGAKTC